LSESFLRIASKIHYFLFLFYVLGEFASTFAWNLIRMSQKGMNEESETLVFGE
jgi:hypothetical protein